MAQRSKALLSAALLSGWLQNICVHALRRTGTHGDALLRDFGSCVPLKNHGSYSTVEVAVGTPPQKFDVVADTGSDNLIVTSCACAQEKHCAAETKCFQGTNVSETFELDDNPGVVTITFGSGPVTTVVTTDRVALGDVVATMQDSLLLMVNKEFDPPEMEIEGILGLGLPKNVSEQAMKDAGAPPEAQAFSASGFLEAANTTRFSLCFNNGDDGVLRLGGRQSSAKPLGSIGDMHWGVGLEGVTVGEAGASGLKATFCDPADMQPGQKTPCGAIVDSGTTMILAPAGQLDELFGLICEGWSKCSERSESKDNATHALLAQVATCDTQGMPSLQFHVTGAEGDKQTLDLPPDLYTLATEADDDTGEESECIMAFQVMDEYNTEENGPIWIFGTPFYYKYVVGYDISTTPPHVSFTEAECTRCGLPKGAQSFIGSRASARRTLSVPPRAPRLDTSVPL